ncbi:MAG: hypothetical protein C0601_12480 [Candidatus Muiribacterium halophilum]|uniref:ABC transporter domain-containing protein n=1 Tax=Muiribacterium halophilum TaxID=2053465 RepID=A0A2N5ZAE0_MUIH1|nr:MAG: hypothetical protein C0601_12480 [Candidatus Muirbacterium halophilum]
MNIVECKDISKKFKDKKILDNVNISIKKNEIISLVALNGQGKTTFFRMLTQLAKPDNGKFLYNGKDRPDENLIFFVPEITKGFPLLNINETVDFFSTLEKNNVDKNALDEVLEKSSLLNETNRTESFSKGMRQKLWLCLAAISKSKLIIIDEPLGGLDIKGKQFFKYVSQKIKENGNTLLCSSHDLETVFEISERFLFIEKKDRKMISKNKDEFHSIKEFKDFFEKVSG